MKRLLLLLALPLFFACSKEESQSSNLSKNQTLSADCLKDEMPFDIGPSQCGFDTSFFCEVIEVQEPYFLSDEDKEWLKAYCLNDFDKIFFHDEEGNETYLEASSHRYSTITTNALGNGCVDDPEKSKTYCIKSDNARVEFRVPIAALSFELSIRNNFSVDEFETIEPSLYIEAVTYNFSNPDNFRIINHFGASVDDNRRSFQIFFPEIDILGRTFKEVYSSNDTNVFPPIDPDALKIFYNKEFGIVSFIDNNNTQWVLNE